MRVQYSKVSKELTQKLNEVSVLVRKGSLSDTVLDLVNIRASQLNHCAFCLDMHVKEAKIHGERELRIYHVPTWRESELFDQKERAALAWTEAVTQLGPEGISQELFEEVSKHLSEQELSDLTYAIATINAWNRLNVAFASPPGALDSYFGLDKAGLS